MNDKHGMRQPMSAKGVLCNVPGGIWLCCRRCQGVYLLALDEALDKLAKNGPRAAELVKLCFFVGLTQEQTAKHLDDSVSTVERTWAYARAWLSREIRGDEVL